jgi:membrane protease YdiL (CAAX protease family)
MPKITRPNSRTSKKSASPASSSSAQQKNDKPTPLAIYLDLSQRPLQVLIFLLPLLILYELGTLLFLSSQGMREIVLARLMLTQLLDAFGAAGFHLPPVLLCVVLLCWHAVYKPKPQMPKGSFSGNVMLGMSIESFLWAIPLVILGSILSQGLSGSGGNLLPFVQSAQPGSSPNELGLMARLTLSIGAGLYEELVFRWVLIALIHFICADLLKTGEHWAYAIAIVLSSIAFAFYHNLRIGPGADLSIPLFITYTLGGAYFALLFVLRGFGIVVATHAMYDIIALALLTR